MLLISVVAEGAAYYLLRLRYRDRNRQPFYDEVGILLLNVLTERILKIDVLLQLRDNDNEILHFEKQ